MMKVTGDSEERSDSGRKAPASAWRSGQSGNPGGPSKVSAEIRDLARDLDAHAIERLVVLMYSKMKAWRFAPRSHCWTEDTVAPGK